MITYIPGYRRWKIAMIFIGIGLFWLGCVQIWTPLRLLMFGKRAMAEVTAAVKVKSGLPELVLTNDLQINDNLEGSDRSYIFWNEFQFQATDGRTINARSPIGSMLGPLYRLTDSEGLPTTALACYDGSNAGVVVFPSLISIWFEPGVLIIAGVFCTTIGAFLFYWSDKPIEMPDVPMNLDGKLREPSERDN